MGTLGTGSGTEPTARCLCKATSLAIRGGRKGSFERKLELFGRTTGNVVHQDVRGHKPTFLNKGIDKLSV